MAELGFMSKPSGSTAHTLKASARSSLFSDSLFVFIGLIERGQLPSVVELGKVAALKVKYKTFLQGGGGGS